MAIHFNEQTKIFHITTEKTSYAFCIAEHGVLEHLYYGKRIAGDDLKYIGNRQIYAFHAHESRDSRKFSAASVGLEVSVFNSGDFRTPSLVYDYEGNLDCNRLRYRSHQIYKGRKPIEGLPYSRENAETETLEVVLSDDENKVELTLFYVVYPSEDVIARSQVIKNTGDGVMTVQKAASMSLDFYGMEFDTITLEGMYLYERAQISRAPLKRGVFQNNSLTGISSHNRNPFIALCAHNTDEDIGEAYGFNLLYSSNFSEEVSVSNLGDTRLIMGLDHTGFCWTLRAGESLASPEAVMTYSDQGLGGMSRNFHDHIRRNIIEREYAFIPRPIVINSWEASYFSVTEELMLSLAKQALDCGADTVVLDDGWFRASTKTGLGDWRTDKQRFPAGLKGLSEKIHGMGLKFGIWIEPEMVNADSALYRTHPDWVLSTSKQPLISRCQYILDLTREEVVNYIADRITEELQGVQLEYIKWDFNRYATEAGSFVTPQGEVYHRQMLGTYKLLSILKTRFPVLFETCSGGGGRFDLGMLYYSPQIWTSDNTDPYARVYIQYGTSLAYPTSCISCHFTKGECTSGRKSSYEFRYRVAEFGSYGYELDLSEFSAEEKAVFKGYSEEYRKDEDLNLNGDLYRLISPESDKFCAYMKVSKDKNKAKLTFLELNATGLYETIVLRLRGLDPNTAYKNEATGEILHGSTLMNAGIRIGDLFGKKRSDGYAVTFTAVEK
ncbi:MAG: alpha-galactosidase [Clostridia bacterium]|nr:alpha-galactosidase [Clostridia bacterium]